MSHNPNITIQETPDCRVLVIQDISYYDSKVPLTNVDIKISVPGQNTYYHPPFAINSTNYYTSINLGGTYYNKCNQDLINLPDGLYEITYSVCPNETLYTTIKYLRTCAIKCKVNELIGKYISACDINKMTPDKIISSQEVLQNLNSYLLIIESAKGDVLNYKYKEAEDKLIYINKKINQY